MGLEYAAGAVAMTPRGSVADGALAGNRAVSVAHAVELPVTDNPVWSVCGVLVIATTDVRWHEVWGVTRCTACVCRTG